MAPLNKIIHSKEDLLDTIQMIKEIAKDLCDALQLDGKAYGVKKKISKVLSFSIELEKALENLFLNCPPIKKVLLGHGVNTARIFHKCKYGGKKEDELATFITEFENIEDVIPEQRNDWDSWPIPDEKEVEKVVKVEENPELKLQTAIKRAIGMKNTVITEEKCEQLLELLTLDELSLYHLEILQKRIEESLKYREIEHSLEDWRYTKFVLPLQKKIISFTETETGYKEKFRQTKEKLNEELLPLKKLIWLPSKVIKSSDDIAKIIKHCKDKAKSMRMNYTGSNAWRSDLNRNNIYAILSEIQSLQTKYEEFILSTYKGNPSGLAYECAFLINEIKRIFEKKLPKG